MAFEYKLKTKFQFQHESYLHELLYKHTEDPRESQK